ncbi:glycine cleavage system protein GcvH [Janthinobacterium sp. B9-8]|uniref:glycine cleavage system protein GcvH n=1 Tax=Janthinobacterium sp. B9-8 TaxID=1236179 RepID=UPI00061D06AD|nr:glycine cleavage system protein GcvH [Janthinobacterium sp. B9-8]AMC33620.1 glycine cleavage system protein H [Janthinobacterium sp. B9-8]
MSIPANLKFTDTHEWLRLEADGSITIGITNHAQEALGDIVFLELPAAGTRYAKNDACGVVESVKAASDIYAPLAGVILESNDDLTNAPEQVNTDAYGAWLFKITPDNAADLDTMLSAADYEKAIG